MSLLTPQELSFRETQETPEQAEIKAEAETREAQRLARILSQINKPTSKESLVTFDLLKKIKDDSERLNNKIQDNFIKKLI